MGPSNTLFSGYLFISRASFVREQKKVVCWPERVVSLDDIQPILQANRCPSKSDFFSCRVRVCGYFRKSAAGLRGQLRSSPFGQPCAVHYKKMCSRHMFPEASRRSFTIL